MYVFKMWKVIGTDPWRFPSTKVNVYYIYNLLYVDLSDFIKTWPLGFRLAPGAPGQCGVQKSRGLAVLFGAAG